MKNEFCDILQQLVTINTNLGEPFKAKAYKTAFDKIETLSIDITDITDIKDVVGKSAFNRLSEYVETGKVEFIEQERSNILHTFAEIYGIGPKKARELSQTIKTLDELRSNEDLLNSKQKIGLKWYEDMKKRIPRIEIDLYYLRLRVIMRDFPNAAEIVGSYRRGSINSGDIDIIFTSKNPTDFQDFVKKFQDELIVDMLTFGKKKSMCFAKLDDAHPARRLDFMYTKPEEYHAAILYFTGSKAFNVKMRSIAKDKGYSLNEYGLFDLKTKRPVTFFTSEKQIFDYLGIEFKIPTERFSSDDCYLIEKCENDEK